MLVLAAACLLAAARDVPALELVLELRQEPTRVGVTLSFEGAPSGRTELLVPDHWASASDLAAGLQGLAVHDGEGAELAGAASSDGSRVVEHAPGELLVVSYELPLRDGPIGASPADHYRPLVTRGLLHAIGHTFLVLPAHLDGDAELDVTLAWVGFEEAGWTALSSFGAGDADFRARPRELQAAVYLAGTGVRVAERDVGDTALRIAVTGDDFRFEDALFFDTAQRVFAAEKGFFDEAGPPGFLISLLEVGDRESRSIGGTGLTRTFCLFVSPSYELAPGSEDAADLQRLLAHELFHHWNGERIRREQPEELVYWFSEGFTDYYARSLLHRSGLWDDARRDRSLETAWAAYFLNPKRSATNEEVRAGFWEDRDLRDLPYRRGDLVAQLADREIRRCSEGEESLDDLVRDVLHRADAGALVDTGSLLELLAARTSEAFAGRMERVLVAGEVPELPEDLVPGRRLVWEERRPFDLGLDFAASQRAGRATGVRPDGPAQAAGLREGDELVGWSVTWDRPDVEAVLQVRGEDGVRDVRFLPRAATPRRVPRLQP